MIRAAQEAESIRILKSKGVYERLKVEPENIHYGSTSLINDRMLLILIKHSEEMVEAHIAQPKEHWKHIHEDINEALRFIVNLGYSEVQTNVRQELMTTINLLTKHGFKPVQTIDSEVILKWVSKQH